MKRFSKTILAATLAVAMVAPVAMNTVYARDSITSTISKDIKDAAKDVEKDIKDAGKDIKKEAEKVEDKAKEEVDKVKEKVEEEKAKEDVKKAVKDEIKAEKDVDKAAKEEVKAVKEAIKEVKVSPQKVTLDGKDVKISGYNIDGNNYYRLRDLAAILAATEAKFKVDYKAPANAQEEGMIILTPGAEYVVLDTDLKDVKAKSTATGTNDKVKVGEKDLKAKAYKIDGNNYYRLRDLADELKFKVDYDKEKDAVILSSKYEELKEDIKKDAEKVKEDVKDTVKDAKKESKEALEAEKKQQEKESETKIGQPAPSEAAGPRK